MIYHPMGGDRKQAIRYEPSTSEIVWEHVSGYRLAADELSGGETVLEPAFETHEIRTITTVELVERSDDILGGEPRIAGTRVGVLDIYELVNDTIIYWSVK